MVGDSGTPGSVVGHRDACHGLKVALTLVASFGLAACPDPACRSELEVHVVDVASQPVEGAQVRIGGECCEGEHCTERSGADGMARFSSSFRWCTITVRREGFGETAWRIPGPTGPVCDAVVRVEIALTPTVE